MITVLGLYPVVGNENDGMVQRIKAIDAIIPAKSKVYIERTLSVKDSIKVMIKKIIGWKQDKKTVQVFDNVTIHKEIDFIRLEDIFKKSEKIYIHSIYNLVNIPLYLLRRYGHKMILDIHGCVADELEYLGEDKKIVEMFNKIELSAFTYIKNMIAVSSNMIDFYKKKYSNSTSNFVYFPIFSTIKNQIGAKQSRITVVYSGGTQKWQNAELMVELIEKFYNVYNFIILTPDIDFFRAKLRGEVIKNITLKSVDKNDVGKFYEGAHLGLILRDNNVVNSVSCPTKLVEYIQFGLVPIVIQSEIGDFNALGYEYILLDEFFNKEITIDIIEHKKSKNIDVFTSLLKSSKYGEKELLDLFR